MELIFENQSSEKISQDLFTPFLSKLQEVIGAIPETQVELLICSDSEIQVLNKTYRHKDAPTDVLAFAERETESSTDSLGQIVISIDRAKEQAEELMQSSEEELKFLFVHGLLHLLGYDHQNLKDEAVMLDKAYRILGRIIR